MASGAWSCTTLQEGMAHVLEDSTLIEEEARLLQRLEAGLGEHRNLV